MSTETTQQVTINVGGMACSGCADTVQQALDDIQGVTRANVDLENEFASITYEANSVSAKDFKQAIEAAGYEFKGTRN